jgi:hypothetical protein
MAHAGRADIACGLKGSVHPGGATASPSGPLGITRVGVGSEDIQTTRDCRIQLGGALGVTGSNRSGSPRSVVCERVNGNSPSACSGGLIRARLAGAKPNLEAKSVSSVK